MPLVLKDRVKETTTTTGTGTVTLAGTTAGFSSFSVIGNANTTYYAIVAQTPGEWEVGIGTYTSSGTTLSRDTVLESSNSGSLVNFSSGVKDVFVTYPGEYAVASSNGLGTSGQVLTSNGPNTTPTFQTASGGASAITISNKTGAYTVVAGDLGTIINCTSGTFTVSLTAAATLGSGFNCWVWNTGTGAITIDPNAAETIDGVATLILRNGEGLQIVCDGTNWQTGDQKEIRSFATNTANSLDRPVASGSVSVAIGAGTGGNTTTASGIRSVAIGWQAKASDYQTALGVNGAGNGAVAETGNGAMALGGSYASGTDSFAAAVADNTSTYGAKGSNSIAIGLGASATATGSKAFGSYSSATGNHSIAIAAATSGFTVASAAVSTAIGANSGGNGSQAVTGAGAMALGGSYASGTDSFAAAIADNTSTYGAKNTWAIAMSYQAVATGLPSIAIGAQSSATGVNCLALGRNASASGLNSTALTYGQAIQDGKYAYQGSFNGNKRTQYGLMVPTADTTDATPSVLTVGSGAASTSNQIILPNNSAYAFTGTIIARRQASGGTASAAWKVEGLIRREANAGTTTLVASTVTAISNVPGWTLALSADTTNGGLAVTATGAAATNIRWVATIQTSEVTFA